MHIPLTLFHPIESLCNTGFQRNKSGMCVAFHLNFFNLGHVQTMTGIFVRNAEGILQSFDIGMKPEAFPFS
jgi:hypothetical protein